MRVAGIHRRGAELFFHPDAVTVRGVPIAWAPVTRLAIDALPSSVGAAIVSVLDLFTEGVPHPEDWDSYDSPFLAAVGASSWGEFTNGALYCAVVEDDPVISFEAMKNRGDGGFNGFMEQRKIELPSNSTVDAMGRAAINALAMCE